MATATRGISFASLLLWYLIWGAVHEFVHVAVAFVLSRRSNIETEWYFDLGFLAHVLLGRQSPLDPNMDLNPDFEIIIRHSGWITSVWIAWFLRDHETKQTRDRRGAAFLAAVLTAIEAISTDLLRIPVIPLFQPILPNSFFCGNFGIILLHQAWLQDGGTSALDVLEKMVQVTMMRGAQSGGVVTLISKSGGYKRTRVVNKKRTSLAKLLRSKLARDVNFRRLPATTHVAGHTRFATSSKATLEGTHPQQWTPRTIRRVWNTAKKIFETIPVENFVTHNGDFEFYTHANKTYDLHVVQAFLSVVTGVPTPAVVDSCAVAGLMDVLRTKGCFALSARYALCFALPTSTLIVSKGSFPSMHQLETIGSVFEDVMQEMLKQSKKLEAIEEPEARHSFAHRVASKMEDRSTDLVKPLGRFVTTTGDQEEGDASLVSFCLATIDAFFDNDLFMTMKNFLHHAKGSFGLCFASSLDGERQICLAARGQTMSVAFYPAKGLICYGSEQAAVKAGLSIPFPGGDPDVLGRSQGDVDNDALRLDLDDLGGEIILLDWVRGPTSKHPLSRPNQGMEVTLLMNGRITAVLYQESSSAEIETDIYHRMTRLTRNPHVRPLKEEPQDPILTDIQDIPKVCQAIQDDWHVNKACTSLNRLTAFHLSRCLRDRLDAHVAGNVPNNAIDILVTGCEVSLWLGEQFASDLQKVFPQLRIAAFSSNKLLGLYGQEIAVPSFGFPLSRPGFNLHDTIVVIVSHSGGTFAPLACSSLLQVSTTPIPLDHARLHSAVY
jgi:hypothetical protein